MTSACSSRATADLTQAAADFPLTAVPAEARKPIWSLAPLLMGFALTSTTLFAGGAIGPAFSIRDLVWIVLLGNLVLAAYCAALGYIAQRSGLPTVLMSRFSFGNRGSRLVDCVLGFTQIGWYAVTNAFLADALTRLLGLPEWFTVAGTVFFTYAFCMTAWVGYTAMDWLSRIAVPAMLILLGISMTLGVRDAGNLTALQPTTSMAFTEALAIVIGTFISGGTQATNWSRFANSPANAVWSTALAFFLINGLLVFVGAFCTLVYGSEDLIQAMAKQGILGAGVVLLILNVWTTQDNTIYNFSLAGTNFCRTTKRSAFVLGGATLALVLALTGAANQVIPFLVFLGVLIPPLGGIIMTDFWIRFRGRFPPLDSPLPSIHWAGVISYVVAAIVAYVTNRASIGVAPIYGILTAAVLYSILIRVLPQQTGETVAEPVPAS